MSDLLHEWLGECIEREVGAVLEWRSENERNRSDQSGKVGDLEYQDDGSNLRVKSAKPQVVQMAKVGIEHALDELFVQTNAPSVHIR